MASHAAPSSAFKNSAFKSRIAHGILAVLCLALLVAAATHGREDWTSFVGDEATYLMQAESLAWDLDVLYTPGDYRRFVDGWQLPPQGLILQSGDGGATITFGKPVFYAAYVAPFLRLAPQRGPFIANALLLIAAAWLAASVLARRIGPWAHLWVASLVFASVAFASTFWMHADLFLMCLSALAFSLLFDLRWRAQGLGPWQVSWRCLAIGALLAAVVFSRPLYVPLLVVAMVLLPRSRRRHVLLTLAGAALLLTSSAALQQHLTDTWTPYGGLRSGFYEHTGFPAVDFAVQQWTDSVKEMGNAAARTPLQTLRDRQQPPSLLAWNSLYFLVGRHVGILAYFLPVLLALWATGQWLTQPHGDETGPSSGAHWSLLLAVAVAVGLFLWSRPYNFYGGGGSLANRYFLPLFPALWFLPTRRIRLVEVVAVTALASLFMWPLWQSPRLFPISKQGDYRYVSPVAQHLLPFETTQSHLRLAGREDLYEGFYLRLVSPSIKRGLDGYFRLEAGEPGVMMLGSVEPLQPIQLVTKSPPGPFLDVEGGRVEGPNPTADGLWTYQLQLDDPEARHPMWWTERPVHLYRLQLQFGEPGGRRAVFRVVLPSGPDAGAPGFHVSNEAAPKEDDP